MPSVPRRTRNASPWPPLGSFLTHVQRISDSLPKPSRDFRQVQSICQESRPVSGINLSRDQRNAYCFGKHDRPESPFKAPETQMKSNEPREMAAYSIGEAAHYLRIPVATLRSWVRGRYYPTEQGRSFFKPLIELPDPNLASLSFVNLVEAHVLDAIRREHNVPLPKVRAALDYVNHHFRDPHPLATHQFQTDGVDLFLSRFEKLIAVSQAGQLAMKEMLAAHLRRVEHDASGLAVRLYPFTRKRDVDEPKIIVIDPYISFGRPAIARRGIATSIVAERYKAGESIDELAQDYDCDRGQVEEAVRVELALAA